jgi:hypothetical protein
MPAEDFDPLGVDGVARGLSIGPAFLFEEKHVDLCACKEDRAWQYGSIIPRPKGAPTDIPAAYIECRNPGAGWEAAPGLGLESKLAMAGRQDQTITRIFSVRRVSSAQVPANPTNRGFLTPYARS